MAAAPRSRVRGSGTAAEGELPVSNDAPPLAKPLQASSDQQAACSRLCVKNIPKYMNESRLKEHFAAKGPVTDVKVLKTRQGVAHVQQPQQLQHRRMLAGEVQSLVPFLRLFYRVCLCGCACASKHPITPPLALQGRPAASNGIYWLQQC